MQTTIGVNNVATVKRWSAQLAIDTEKKSYWHRKFVTDGKNSPIQRLVDLEDQPGDTVKYDLLMRMRGGVTLGDNLIEGNEESFVFMQDQVVIDQVRKAGSAGGRMSRKRTLHDLRKYAKDLVAKYLGEWLDEGYFVYLTGDTAMTAINQDAKFSGVGFAGNPIQAPDVDHILYGGAATSKASLTAADKMSVAFLERVAVKPTMMNAVNPDVVRMSPIDIEGDETFIVLMSPFQAFQLRTETGDLSWTKIQQTLATCEGRNSPMVKGGLGKINNLVLHDHASVRRFGDYGAGANVGAARALLLGAQAGVVAYGSGGNNTRMTWVEKLADADNLVNIYAGMIVGMKKTQFAGKDFGVCALDTACKDPNT